MPRSPIRPSPDHRPFPMSQVTLARLVGRTRQNIHMLLKGSLSAARLEDGAVDVRHPVLRQHARVHWGVDPAELAHPLPVPRRPVPRQPLPQLALLPRIIDLGEFAEMLGLPVDEVIADFSKPPLSDAIIPRGHVSVSQFAELAEVPTRDVVLACRGKLGRAVTQRGLLDLCHPASLAFMHAHPFGENVPAGYLAAACVGEEIDVDHPVARVFLARSGLRDGRLPDVAEP